MIIRFIVNNIYSFGEEREFSLIPSNRLKTLSHHKQKFGNIELLKTAAIYGANASGKSNLIKSISLLQQLVLNANINIVNYIHKFLNDDDEKVQSLAIEYIQSNVVYYFGVEFKNGVIIQEELFESGLGVKQDELIYRRTQNENENKINIEFPDQYANDSHVEILKEILIDEFASPNKLIFRILSKREHYIFNKIKNAYSWFSENLQIIRTDDRAANLTLRFDSDSIFKTYAEEVIKSFNVGISSLEIEEQKLRDYFGSDNSEEEINDLIQQVENKKDKRLSINNRVTGINLVIEKRDQDFFVRQLNFQHTGKNNLRKSFNILEESEGTVRLLDFIPVFRSLVISSKVYLIDEIEKSLHPLIIKELISKFSNTPSTKGQLIFTTHESNLLDQDIFRQDEIWFTEKNKDGVTDLYSLVDFKEHKTISIKKGYLNGRYGAIPFLGNLKDLNWAKNDQ